MTEFMTMAEAFKCGDDDAPYCELDSGTYNPILSEKRATKREIIKNILREEIRVMYAISDQWQVHKADPKVLTAYEIRDQVKNDLIYCDIPKTSVALKAAKMGIESGELKQLVKNKELGLLVDRYRVLLYRIASSSVGHSPGPVYVSGLFSKEWIDNQLKDLNNLKPLNPNESNLQTTKP